MSSVRPLQKVQRRAILTFPILHVRQPTRLLTHSSAFPALVVVQDLDFYDLETSKKFHTDLFRFQLLKHFQD